LLAQAAAANTPWRKNIRLENAKLNLRSFKSIGKFQSMFLFPLWEFLCGGIAPLLAGTLGLRTKVIDSTRYGSGFPAGIFVF
jgi:hypothetical protein